MRRAAVYLFFAASTLALVASVGLVDVGPVDNFLRWLGWLLRLIGGAG